jgi:serine/threonine protein kinase
MRLNLDKRSWTRGEALDADKGGFGSVFEALSEDGATAVVKFVPKAPGAERELLLGDLLSVESLPHVVPVIDSGEAGDYWVIVMPKAEKSLWMYLQEQGGSLDTEETISVLKDIAIALKAIDNKVVHRDLKPQNILLLNGQWCLADFGIARYAEAATAEETWKGSLSAQYASPEQWNYEHATNAVDIYSFGVLAYQLISGRLPFFGPSIPDFRRQHLGETPADLKLGTPRLRLLIQDCLSKLPEMRPSASKLLERLQTANQVAALPGLTKLSNISKDISDKNARDQAKELADRSEAEHLTGMFNHAVQMFGRFANPLLEVIEAEAPSANIERDSTGGNELFKVELSGAKLTVFRPKPAAPWNGPFTIIGFAAIRCETPSSRNGWYGRSHSLWFCDAKEESHFAWHETAFMHTMGSGNAYDPFSLTPPEAAAALNPGMATRQVAWPVEEIDPEEPTEFLDRWLGWFAAAAEGSFVRPSRMPERSPNGSWRR